MLITLEQQQPREIEHGKAFTINKLYLVFRVLWGDFLGLFKTNYRRFDILLTVTLMIKVDFSVPISLACILFLSFGNVNF